MTNNEELKSCPIPFCGGKGYICHSDVSVNAFFVKCQKCGCETPPYESLIDSETSEEQTINAWNKRAEK